MDKLSISSDSDDGGSTPPPDRNNIEKEIPKTSTPVKERSSVKIRRTDGRNLKPTESKARIQNESISPRDAAGNLLRGLKSFGERPSSKAKLSSGVKKSNERARMADAITTAHRRNQNVKPSFKRGRTLVGGSDISPIADPIKDELSPRDDRIEPVDDHEKFDLDMSKIKSNPSKPQSYRSPRSYRPVRAEAKANLGVSSGVIETSIDTVVDMGDDVNLHVSPGDVDRLAVDMIEELMIQVDKHINWTYNKAYFYKSLEKIIYLTLQGISATCTVLGLMLGSSGNESSKFFFIIGVLNAIGLLLFEVNDRYKFDKTASKLFQCTQEFEEMKTELRELKVSSLGPIQRLDAIRSYEKRLNRIEMDAFNSQTFKIGGPTEFNSCKGDVDYFHPIKPDDIPVDDPTDDEQHGSQLGDIINRKNEFTEE